MELQGKVKFVVDLSWLHSRSRYAFTDLTWEIDGIKYATGTIHGVYEALMGVLESYGEDVEIILAMDGTPRKQQGLSGGYKGGRESDNSLGLVQISRWDVARQFSVLPQVKLAYHKWMEGDEVMGHIAKTKKEDETVILFTGDGDMRQLIDSTNNVYCAYEFKRDKGYVLEDEIHLFNQGIKELDGLEPSAVALHLAITGDSSDGIYGIPRFLKAVSKEICNQAKTIDGLRDMVAKVDDMPDSKVKKGLLKIKEEFKQVETNWLMTYIDPLYLPTYYTKDDFKPEEVNLAWFDKYGCQKAYNDIAAIIGLDTSGKIEEGDHSNVMGQALPDNTIQGPAQEFDFGG
jgi:5'-3' exonuclease